MGRAAHRELSKCIWEVLCLRRPKKQKHSPESALNNFSKFSTEPKMEPLISKAAACNFSEKEIHHGNSPMAFPNFWSQILSRAYHEKFKWSNEILTLFRTGLFGAAEGLGVAKRPPSLKSVTDILQWWNLAQLYLT